MKTNVVDLRSTSFEHWRTRLEAARGAAVANIIQFGTVCYEFQQACASKRGGSVYGAKMQEWFGIKDSAASHWALIGRHRDKLRGNATKLPPDADSIYRLLALPEKVIKEKVTRKMKRAEVVALVRDEKPTTYVPRPLTAKEKHEQFRTAFYEVAAMLFTVSNFIATFGEPMKAQEFSAELKKMKGLTRDIITHLERIEK
jgi:hypothetical protein